MGDFYSVQAAAPTSGTTVDITYGSTIGTPVGVQLFMTRTGSPNSGSDAYLSVGCSDGTNQWVSAIGIPDLTAASGYIRRATTRCVLLVNHTSGGTVLGSLSFNSFVADGVRLNVDTAFPTGYTITAKFQIGGSAKATTGMLAAPGTSTTVTFGFQPEGIPLVSAAYATPFDDTAVNDVACIQGVAGWDDADVLTQGCVSWRTKYDSAAHLWKSSTVIDDANVIRDHTDTALDDYWTITARSSTGITVTGTGVISSGTEVAGWYAFAGASKKSCVVKTEKMTSGTGSQTFTGYDGVIEGLDVLTTTAASKNTVVNNFAAAANGLGVATGTSEQFGHFVALRDGATGTAKSGTETNVGLARGFTNFGGARKTIFSLTTFGTAQYTINKVSSVAAYFVAMTTAPGSGATVWIKGNVLLKGNALIK